MGVNAGVIPGQHGGVKPGQWGLAVSFGLCGGDLAGVGIDDLGGGLVLLRPGRRAAAPDRLLEAIAVAVHGQDADVVGEPVQQGAGEPLRSQDGFPVLEREVRRDGRAPLVALREGLEEQLGSGWRKRPQPSSSTISSFTACRSRWILRRRRSSRASISWVTRDAAVVNATVNPFWQAASPRARATWLLPVPHEPAPYCRASGISGPNHLSVPPACGRNGRSIARPAPRRGRSSRHPAA